MNEPPTEIPENPDTPDQSDNPENPDPDDPDNLEPTTGKILIVYYSFTITCIPRQRPAHADRADVIRVEPTEKGLDYAANNYAIGSAQIQAIRNNPGSASSYPAIDPVEVEFGRYGTIIVAAPLWWSNMAAPLQTFLFNHGAEMAGKRIGLIVSSSSSGISGVESDARRLIPRWELPDAEPLDSFVSDIQLPLDDSPVAERYRLYGIKKRRYEKDIPASDAACSCDDFRRVQRRER